MALLILPLQAQKSSPPIWFGSQYTDALKKIAENRELIHAQFKRAATNEKEAISIVFPEMLRYSLWQDLFETKALETLYTKSGSSAADFSIGWFQMKPSFAEQIENQTNKDPLLKTKYKHLSKFGANPKITTASRYERIQRLKSFEWQLIYLSAFTDICQKKFSQKNKNNKAKLKLMAAAYNKGITTPYEELEQFEFKKTFPYGPDNENPFSYVEIAIYFYENDANTLN